MKAAIVHATGQAPVFGDFAEPQAGPGEQRIAVKASALSQLTRARASGTHYSSSGGFPFVAGVDGTGALEDGRRVYFMLPRAPFGAMAEHSVAPVSHSLELPDALDDVTAAAIANPGMSSWAALTERARFVAGETVLINGATGASGQLAVQIARLMGAARVIATGRNRAVLEGLGADATIALTDDGAALDAAFAAEFAQGVDVVLDYLWGPSAERLLVAAAKHGPEAVPIRFVQIGTSSGADIRLPGAVLRSSALELMGSGIGSVPLSRLLAAIAGVFAAGAAGGLGLASTSVPLTDVAKVWSEAGDARVVFTAA
jgi:NADPH:quinone reductase-like Zn-dependent oxidoreductase